MKIKLLSIIAFLFLFLGTNAQSWQTVGYNDFSAGATNYTCVEIGPTGTPFVAYMDGANSLKLSVMKFDGSNWVYVGTAGFSSGQSRYISIDVDNSNIPYVSYYDSSIGKVIVQKFNGTTWVNVGLYLTTSSGAFTSLRLDSSGLPVVAFQDGFMGGVTVKKFDGSAWNLVGTAGFSAGEAEYISLQLDNTGTPYVAYEDFVNSNMASVMKFDGSNWVNVGSAGFSAGSVEYTELDIDASGTPYVAFQDDAASSRATVMKFNGTSWVLVGTAGFSISSATYVDLLISGSGIPYVTYRDSFSGSPFVKYFNGTTWIGMSSGITSGTADFTSLARYNSTLYFCYQEGSSSFEANLMEYALPIGIAENNIVDASIAYPNPFNVSSVVEFGSTVKDGTLTLYNATGQKLRIISAVSGDRITIERDNLITGIYFYSLEQNSELKARGTIEIID